MKEIVTLHRYPNITGIFELWQEDNVSIIGSTESLLKIIGVTRKEILLGKQTMNYKVFFIGIYTP